MLSLLIAEKMVFAFHLEAEFTCLYLEGGELSSWKLKRLCGSAAVRKSEGVGGRREHELKPLLGCSHLELINQQRYHVS